MESHNTNIFKDFASKSSKHKSLSLKEKKISAEKNGETNKNTFLSKETSQKDLLGLKEEIENKCSVVNKAFELIIIENKNINYNDYNDFVAKLHKWLENINSNKILIQEKSEITFETDINESVMLDIFIVKIKLLFSKLLILDRRSMLENLDSSSFVKLLKTHYYRSSKLKSIFIELFNGENSPKKELLRILKIDYFQKCINNEDFHPDSLTNILSLQEDNLRILDLSNHYLPLNNGGKLLSYSKFLQTVFESETYLEGMMVLLNTQSKYNEFTNDDIKESMSVICKYLFHPIVFPNQEITKLYGITCINLNVYVSSFVIDNIENKIDLVYNFGENDLERNIDLKSDCLDNSRIGVEFCVLILTIIYESFRILSRHLVEPKVCIETEDIDKDTLLNDILAYTRRENKYTFLQIDRKLNIKGEILDYILFGGNLLNLVAEEVQYILNFENWRKNLETFRSEFIEIRFQLKHRLSLSKELMFGNPTRTGPRVCGNRRSAP